MWSLWFTEDSKWARVTSTTPGPAPGYMVGGPNSSFTIDPCCTDGTKCGGGTPYQACSMNLQPPLNQPAAKSFLQFANGWPLRAYEITETSDSYQTNYIRMLASFVS